MTAQQLREDRLTSQLELQGARRELETATAAYWQAAELIRANDANPDTYPEADADFAREAAELALAAEAVAELARHHADACQAVAAHR